MPKITDPAYRLPIIYPTEIVDVMESGANKPVHIRGFDVATQVKEEYVVKILASERMGDPAAAMRELLAAFIAKELDIPVAEPVVINLGNDFADLPGDAALKQRFYKSMGLNFGTRHVGVGFQVFALLSSFPVKLLAQAQDLIAFDLLIQNPDRTKEKPNMLTDGTHLVAIDHELAFSFDKILFAPVNLWQQTGDLRRWINELVLLSAVKGLAYNFDDFSMRMDNLNDHFWERAEELIPVPWMHDSFQSIKSKMLGFINQRKEFIDELKIIMS